MSRRRTSFSLRCWQSVGTAVVVAAPFLAADGAVRFLVWVVGR